MAVTVPSTDGVNYALQTQITAVAALLSAAPTSNPAQVPELTTLLDSLQQQLVGNLMAANLSRVPGGGMASNNKPSFLSAAGILSAGTINT